jgi:hypothetical protein
MVAKLISSDTTAPSGRELYHLQFSLLVASLETFGYALVCLYFYGLDQVRSPQSLLSASVQYMNSLKYYHFLKSVAVECLHVITYVSYLHLFLNMSETVHCV